MKLKTLLVSAEVHPFAKTGRLADVSGALPPALKKLGHDIRVIMPKYPCTANDNILSETVLQKSHSISGKSKNIYSSARSSSFTTKHTGTRLGLSICRKVIENHARTIRVENQSGKGIIVYLHLPLQNNPDYYKN